MKYLLVRKWISLMVVLMAVMASAHAQSTTVIKVSIPFEFQFGNQTFPAGDYSLTQPEQHVMVLRNARGVTVAQRFVVDIESATPASATRLTFYNHDGRHVLSEVWQQEDTAGQWLFPVKSQTKLAAQKRSPEARAAAEGSQP